MKRVVSVVTVLVLCLSLVCPVFAAEGTFTPSVSSKNHPEIVPTPDGAIGVLVDGDGKEIAPVEEGCLVVTPVSKADSSADIPADAKETLLDVYEKLSDGSMQLPYEDNAEDMVIRDLFDASLICTDGHKESLAEEGVCIELTFDLGVGANVDVVAMTYVDGKWSPIVSVVNNGDGTVTCVFEEICPIAFAVAEEAYSGPAQTGDAVGSNLILWVALMAVSAAVLVVLLFSRRKTAK